MSTIRYRTFRAGDAAALAEAWTEAAPGDAITERRLRDQVLLDRNFDRTGLIVALDGERIVGSAYAVRRRVAWHADDLQAGTGWIPFFFVRPDARRQGIGARLLAHALDWLHDHGVETAVFSSYTPNYFTPGLDIDRYPEAERLLGRTGFLPRVTAVAMDRSLLDYRMPDDVRARLAALRAEGWYFGSPSGDDLPELIELATEHFTPDWGRAIREGVLGGQELERIVICRDPAGRMQGWAEHGAYEHVIERFGPFGVVPESRGTGLGKLLLHVTLERMRALGAHSAWFLWTDTASAAGGLYLATGFQVTRRFTILELSLGAA